MEQQRRQCVLRNGRNLVVRVDRESAFDDQTGIKVGPADSDRGLGFSEKRDLVIINPDDSFCVDFLQEHYRALGLETGSVMIGDDYNVVEGVSRNYDVLPFLFDNKAHSFRPNERRLQITQAMRSKNNFIDTCKKLALPIPQTWRFASLEEMIDPERFMYPCWFKPDLGFTGRGVLKFDTAEALVKHLGSIDSSAPFQIQAHLDQAETFINVAYHAQAGKAARLLATDQILGGHSREEHMGNTYDPHNDFYRVWQHTDILASHLAASGMEGIFAFDVAQCKSTRGDIYYVMIECNPRPNGSSFPTRLVSRLTGSIDDYPWLAESLPTSLTSLEQIDLGKYLYNPQTMTGAVVHIASTIQRGRLGLTFVAPTMSKVKELRNEVAAMLA